LPARKIRAALHFIRPWIKTVLAAWTGLMLTASTPALGREAQVLQFDQGDNRFETINRLTGNFSRSGNEVPVPEPGSTLLSVTGGMLLLVLSNRRHRLGDRHRTRRASPIQRHRGEMLAAGEPKFSETPSGAAPASDIVPLELLNDGLKPADMPCLRH
jgi:hypothetical protein